MAIQFVWGPLTRGGPPAPLIEVAISSRHHRTRLIKGLFDSGADVTTLRMEWKDALRIQDGECYETKLTGICGPDNPITAIQTVLDATLDGHTFRMPVAFAKVVPTDLFGRAALLERFRVVLDAQAGLTTLDWTAAATAPLAAWYEQHWREQTTKAPAQPAPDSTAS